MNAMYQQNSQKNQPPGSTRAATGLPQRGQSMTGGNKVHEGSAPPEVNRALRTPGLPLDARARSDLEPRFGHDFSRVRVHTGDQAARSAGAMDALAYTVGQDIVFNQGMYAPGTSGGRSLIAHELTHVVQQAGAAPSPGSLAIGAAHSTAEQEAGSVAARQGGSVDAPLAARNALGVQTIQRSPAPGTTSASPAPARPVREVIAIRLDHRESGGLGRFDTLLYRDCGMKVQFRMNFNFTGPWPNESDKRDWQDRFITSVRSAWSNRFDLEATGPCAFGCGRVQPFVEIYAPHSSPHIVVDVAYTTTNITSYVEGGGGAAHLDSLDLTPVNKGPLTAQQRADEGVRPMTPAVHEFGHMIGRRDQYNADQTGCAPGYPLRGIMCFGSEVQDVDYQPFANALNAMTGCTYQVVPRQIGDFPIPPDTGTRLAGTGEGAAEETSALA